MYNLPATIVTTVVCTTLFATLIFYADYSDGHSAGGPGSVGVVYYTHDGGSPHTVAAFTAGSDGSVADDEALRCLSRM